MVEVKKQGLQIDGIAASSAIDTSSESIDIENLDISSLQAGHGVFLVEHKKPKDEKVVRVVESPLTPPPERPAVKKEKVIKEVK